MMDHNDHHLHQKKLEEYLKEDLLYSRLPLGWTGR